MGNKNSRNRIQPDQLKLDEHENAESFKVLWLNERPKETLLQDEYYSEQIQFLERYNLRLFEDYLECGTYLYELPTCARVILLVQEQLAEDIVHAAHSLCTIKFIFIVYPVSSSTGYGDNLFSQYMKVKYISLDQVVNRIRFFEARFLRNSKEFFSVDIFKADQTLEISTTNINGRFLFTQLLIDILLRMEPKPTDKDEFIAQCSKFFANNPAELKKLEKFHLDYTREKVFEWYSKDAFVYRLLNKALRTQNIDLIFLFRFVLQDLHQQLILHQERAPVCVYRGQRLSKKEWEDLSSSKDQYISMNSMLSTSLRKDIAEHYILKNDTNVEEFDEVFVMFQIEANPHLPGGIKPFANISLYSQFPVEDEIIFMAGCIFRIIQVISGDPFSTVRMELCGNEENNLKMLFESMRSEYEGRLAGKENAADLNSFGTVLFNMDEFYMAGRFFRRIYYETALNDPNRPRYCMNIGNVALHTGQYKECVRWYNQAFELYKTNGLIDHPIVGNLYLARGDLYTMMNKRRQALEAYNQALSTFQTHFGDNYPLVALCYNSMARHFERRKHFRFAVEYRERALRIAEKTLPPMHPYLVLLHLGMSQLLLNLRHQNVQGALDHAEIALQIANATLPLGHPNFFGIYETLNEIYKLMRNVEQSIIYRNKIENLRVFYPADFVVLRTKRRTEFVCDRCYRYVWIYRHFEWMKNTRLNCLVFHEFWAFLLNTKRYCFHY